MVDLRRSANKAHNRANLPPFQTIGSDSENGDWVDEDHADSAEGGPSAAQANSGTSASARSSPHPQASPRKRRRGAGPASSRGTTRSPRVQAFSQAVEPPSRRDVREIKEESPAPNVSRPARPRTQLIRSDDVLDDVVTGVHHTWDYGFSILRPALSILRYILIPIVVLCVLAFILTKVSSTLSSAFTPFCYIPGLSYTPMCRWVNAYNDIPKNRPANAVHWADYPKLVEVQSKTFEQMLDEAVLGATTPSSLSLDLKKTEMATADLIALVRLSNLKSRESLAETLSEFVSSARGAGRSLARLDAKMNGAMDSIMAMNDYALHAIEGARANEPSKLAMALIPWSSGKTADQVVKETFIDAMNVLSEHLERIILEVETNTQNLDALEEKLNTLRSIVAREDASVSADREELLSYLWTKLGGNRKDLKNFERNLKMLGDLGNYRKAAQARVVATLHTLERVSQDMGDMRERVAAPNLAGSQIAPEIHMKSIRNGLERLSEGRKRARTLEEEALRKALETSPSYA